MTYQPSEIVVELHRRAEEYRRNQARQVAPSVADVLEDRLDMLDVALEDLTGVIAAAVGAAGEEPEPAPERHLYLVR
jgi:hypothetical protein